MIRIPVWNLVIHAQENLNSLGDLPNAPVPSKTAIFTYSLAPYLVGGFVLILLIALILMVKKKKRKVADAPEKTGGKPPQDQAGQSQPDKTGEYQKFYGKF